MQSNQEQGGGKRMPPVEPPQRDGVRRNRRAQSECRDTELGDCVRSPEHVKKRGLYNRKKWGIREHIERRIMQVILCRKLLKGQKLKLNRVHQITAEHTIQGVPRSLAPPKRTFARRCEE